MQLGGKGCRSRCIPHQIGERCHENASDCLRVDRCGGDAGDTSTCHFLTRLPSRPTIPRVPAPPPPFLPPPPAFLAPPALLSPPPAILRSAAAILWSATSLLRLRLGQPNPAVDEKPSGPLRNAVQAWKCRRRCSPRADEVI